jgi:hypothetical protein
MLTDTQLRELSTLIEDALQIALHQPNGLAARIIEMASLEVCQQLKSRRNDRRAAA